MTPEEIATAVADLERFRRHLVEVRLTARATARRLDLRRPSRNTFRNPARIPKAAWRAYWRHRDRLSADELALIDAGSGARNLAPYVRRSLRALRAGRLPDSRDFVVGVARACPSLGRRLFPLALVGTEAAR
jgi:hypothetical protein